MFGLARAAGLEPGHDGRAGGEVHDGPVGQRVVEAGELAEDLTDPLGVAAELGPSLVKEVEGVVVALVLLPEAAAVGPPLR